MKQIIVTFLVLFLLAPMLTLSAQAATDTKGNQLTVVNNLNNSKTVDSIEETRNNNNTGSFDEFIQKIRKPSIPIGITLVALSGFMLFVGFWIKPLQKAGGALLAGVLFALFLINYSEYLVGWMFAAYDFLVGYF